MDVDAVTLKIIYMDISTEKRILEHTAQVWNESLTLVSMHPDDQKDIRFHIHAIQNIILARIGQKTLRHEREQGT